MREASPSPEAAVGPGDFADLPAPPTLWDTLSLRLPNDPPDAVRYGAGIAAGVATWLTAEALDAMVGQPIVGFGVPLIAVATWFGGSRAAIVALLTATLLLLAFTFDPAMRPWVNSGLHAAFISVLIFFTAVDIVLCETTRSSALANNRLATRQRQLLTALLASDDRWRKLTDAAPAIITQTRASDGAVIFANEVAETYTGPRIPQPREARLNVLTHPDDLQPMLDAHRCLEDPDVQSVSYEWRIRRHHPPRRPAEPA